ncbi:hypothetical protein OsI_23169 [Oryza sativa Indica Group]|uniref:Uncharacterized protein n=1 Tax=Oryza sativa subsp. indica TaxID=39946 RepID=B8B341_ORYSI|nr:hypothetical protein OsI_23169 [Oryza sativa Indica Group]
MEGVKSLIACMLVLGLVLQQEKIQVEGKSCCPSTIARNVYNSCRFVGGSRDTSAKLSGCKIVDGKCKPPYIHHSLHPESSAGNEEGNHVVDRCNDACYRFCTKEDYHRCFLSKCNTQAEGASHIEAY